MPSEKLKPCPFCGGCAERIEVVEDDGFNNRGGSAIECQTCRASSHVEFGRKENLISSWNRRTAAEQAEPAPAALSGAVKVKALEWTEYETDGWADRADAEAGSFGVFYNIDIQTDGYRVVFDHEAVGAIGTFETLDEAKAAAQADYERRILSALEPAPDAEPVVLSEKSFTGIMEWVDNPPKPTEKLKEVYQAYLDNKFKSGSNRPPESRLREALEPFADIADLIDSETEGMAETDELKLLFHDFLFASWPVSLFRKARAALEQEDGR